MILGALDGKIAMWGKGGGGELHSKAYALTV